MRPLLAIALLFSPTVFANGAGALGYTGGPPANTNCNGCHTGGGAPNVTITGPATLPAGATGNYTLTITGGARYGMNVSAVFPQGKATLNPVSNNVGVAFGELHQTAPSASGTFNFTMTAPPFPGTATIYATGNACNGDGNTGGDSSRSTTLAVTVNAGTGTLPPVITADAGIDSRPVRARTAEVTVGANDDGSEAVLAYTWAATGPAPVTFQPNGNNAAKLSTATFSKQGLYALTVTVRDGTNRSVTDGFMVPVDATYSLLRLTPASMQIPAGANQQYTVSARDQFDAPLATQPTPLFAVPAGGGSISATGLLKAQAGVGGNFVVTANVGAITTSAIFAVGKAPEASASADTKPPTVTLISPEAPGLPLTAATVFEANAIDDRGVAEVRFEIGKVPVGSVMTGPPWKTTYNGAQLVEGTQPLEAIAKDLSGNEARSTALPVVVPPGMSGTGGGTGTGTGGTGGSSTGGNGGGKGGGSGGTAPGGCGCNASPVGLAAIALLALVRRRSRRD